jgi:hypothetical protein
MRRIISVMIVLCVVSGCSRDENGTESNVGSPTSYEAFAFKYANNPGPGERITYLQGFSFAAPQGENWIEGPREPAPDPKNHGTVHRLRFFKLFPQQEGAALHAGGADVFTMFPAYKPPNPKDFMQFRLRGTMAFDKALTSRNTLSQKGGLDDSLGYECFKYETVFEIRNVEGHKDVPFTVRNRMVECLSPSRNLVVRLIYGQMTAPGVQPADMTAEGEEFFRSLRFADDRIPEAAAQGGAADRLPTAPVGDHSIILGERIGPIHLSHNISAVSKLFGKGVEKRPGIWPWSSLFTWEPLGLWIIADQETGNIVWLSIDQRADKRWAAEFASPEGIRLGMKEESVREILGEPERKVSGGGSTSYYYDRRGVRLTFLDGGPSAGIVGSLRVVWPAIPRGDTTIVPGSRISGVEVTASVPKTLLVLGGGYGKFQIQGLQSYYWPHLGLGFLEKDGHVAAMRAMAETKDIQTIRYLTPEGLGVGSTLAEVKATYGKPSASTKGPSGQTLLVFRTRGIAFGLNEESVVTLVEVFTSLIDVADSVLTAFFEEQRAAHDNSRCEVLRFC